MLASSMLRAPAVAGRMKGVFFSHRLPNLCELRTFPIPKPDKQEILVKNVCVASNPKDFKYPEWNREWHSIEGNDIAGVVEGVGEGVTEFKKGDRVAAYTKMHTDIKFGAYAEYTVAPAHTSFHIGSKTSFQNAATLPLASMTACIGLFRFLQLPEPPVEPYSEDRRSQAVLINGASSTVGGYGVQLAKLAGYTVIGIAGQACTHAQNLGADHVIDYCGKTDEDIARAVKTILKDSGCELAAVFDAVSSEATASMLVNHVMQPQGGKIANVLTMFGEEGMLPKPDNIEAVRVRVRTAYGQHSDFASKWFRQISKWVEEGVFKPAPVKVMPNGLDSVQEGMQLLRDGKVSAQKLVYNIIDTSDL